jgi:hypothetical protein
MKLFINAECESCSHTWRIDVKLRNLTSGGGELDVVRVGDSGAKDMHEVELPIAPITCPNCGTIQTDLPFAS